MDVLLIIVYFVSFFILFIAGAVVVHKVRTKGQVERALNMTLYLVKVTRGTFAGEEKRNAKDLIAVTEQLISSFSNLHATGWNKFIFGEPYLSLEIAVHNIGSEIHFYIAVPRSSEDLISKQIYAWFPDAEITKSGDYNIFDANEVAAGSYLYYTGNAILPIRTYARLEADPLSGILSSMLKASGRGEGAALQMLIRPSHATNVKTLAEKVARVMQSGYNFRDALQKANHPPKPPKTDPNKPIQPEKLRVVTPTDDEMIKAIAAKASKSLFDVNL